jgi:DGQHR domain-containing protein
MLPNALVIAFDSRVRFEPSAEPGEDGAQTGHLVIPVGDTVPDEDKPGWIVDGQQRSAAIRDANVESFPVYVTAFVTDSVREQRAQFILVNSSKPLPKGLIHELLPSTPAEDLPPVLLKKRLPAILLDRLNYESQSPLHERIRTPTTTKGVIKDNSVLKMLAMSIEDGALYQWFDGTTGHGEIEPMLELLKNYWEAVATVFPEAWEEVPRRSRLVHGVGIVALGALMDELAHELREEGIPSVARFEEELRKIEDDCAWTDGVWAFSDEDQRRWNLLENTPRDIKLLTDHLLRSYRAKASAGRRLTAVA